MRREKERDVLANKGIAKNELEILRQRRTGREKRVKRGSEKKGKKKGHFKDNKGANEKEQKKK